ncbi:MAG: hypothetical protein NXI23_15980 [Bacteroidetes bacterium]|jgi:tetratricopeptide (TPR) repeat protein|nr:hypothetical protein [Bacteroidota bacterium]
MKQLLALLSFGLLILTNCTQPNQTSEPVSEEDKLGKISYDYKGSDDAQPAFKKALLLLHNFEYDDACEAFLEAQKIDSTFVMAYWGEAMTYNHTLWREQEYDKAREALKKLADTQEDRMKMAASELEKDFLSALEVLYGEGTKKQRDSLYSDHLKKMYKKYPENHEVASFYALSSLGAAKNGNDLEAFRRGEKVAKNIIADNPNHPGALHYLIHSCDDPEYAHLALNAAYSYSKVAADAAHALHMPSHIFVALGMWDEVVASNIASWNAGLKRKEAKGLDNDALNYHAFHWKTYGLLNLGKFDEAAQHTRDMNKYTTEKPSKTARRYFLGMIGNYLVESGNWESDIAEFGMDKEDMGFHFQSLYSFLDGMKAYVNKEPDSLLRVINKMEKERDEASRTISDEGIPMCAGTVPNLPNQGAIDKAKVLELELRALHAWNTSEAEKWLQQATELQESLPKPSGPIYIIKPSFDLYADWLIENNRPKEAAIQFEKSLERSPRRMAALKGKLRVAELLGDEKTVKEMLKELEGGETKI